ncbi:winged helix-turn-helix domain-containing protein, partial [Dokdonella sp.]|uniref:winged helix-turn-helix domain-containing protein n=1 Tax=Dokdonella sp. TaxID=2291710 RepID=UPI001B2E26EE
MAQLRFESFLLDPARRELRRGEERLTLPPKVFDCIAYLAEHRERAVGRDELIAAVWGRTEVTDNLLDQIMLRARRALGDTEGERRVIRTVPRFGFSWVAPTSVVDGDSGSATAEAQETQAAFEPPSPSENDIPPAPIPPLAAPARRAPAYAIAALLLLLVVAGIAAWIVRAPPASAPANAASNLAMLLPVSVDADPRYAWARLGAMDLIADRLRGSGQPMLPSDNVIALLRGRGEKPVDAGAAQELARSTAASLVLGAEAQHASGYWRVTIRSLHGRDPPLLADGEARDLLEAARAAADRAARALGLT